MNRMRIGGLAAGMFVVGLLTGLAGTAVAREEPSAADCTAVMADLMEGQGMTSMMSMMGGSMMGGSMMGGSMMGPDASAMPWTQHERHHGPRTPEDPE